MNALRNRTAFHYHAKLQDTKRIKKIKKVKNPMAYTLIGYAYNRPVYVPDDAKHVFICGTTGSGKTVAIANYIKHACENNYPALIIDGKGDINSGSLLYYTVNFSRRKTYVVNLTDIKRSAKYNPFRNASPTVCKDMLINLTNWSEEHYKLNTERYLLRVITLMAKNKIILSFKSILFCAAPSRFSELSFNSQKHEIITKDEHIDNLELIKNSGKIIEGAIARFSLLLESELGAIFDDNGIDITTALKENATILFILNPLIYPETSALMGRLILIDSKKAISNLFHDTRRKFFIFDEINSYASSVLIDLVNKSRSASVTCVLATQSLSDLDASVNESFKEQVIENCNNYILLRQNSAKNAESWANIIGTRHTIDTTYQLSSKGGSVTPTGAGTIKFNKEYIYHPDEIKNLRVGEAFFVSKDTGEKYKIIVNKPI